MSDTGGAARDGAPLLTRAGPALTIRLNRPGQRNRIDPADIAILQRAFDDAANDPALRALILTGTGERSFCSGFTLQAIEHQLDDAFPRMLDTLERLPIVTIAAIAGGVYGGGIDLALCCDIRIGTPAARMFMPAARFGLHYYPSGMRRYVERLGLSTAQKLFLTAHPLEADAMLRSGFLTDLVDASELARAVDEFTAAIAATEPRAVAAMKRNLQAIASGRADWSAIEADHVASLRSTELRERLRRALG